MKCPKCADKTDKVATGNGKLDYILACWACSWQCASYHLQAWFDKWRV